MAATMPAMLPYAPAPPGMRWERHAASIETTTFQDEQPTYIVRDMLVPIKPGANCTCSYCTRMGVYGSMCDGCGAVVKP